MSQKIKIAISGHVDHGKSSLIGRLLAETGNIPKEKQELVLKLSKQLNRPFEYAYYLDALREEQNQGITIDSARCFFRWKEKSYLFIDAPGHIEFTKNMFTSVTHTDHVILVTDALEGIQENTKRHAFILSLLHFETIFVLINKMDLVDYKEEIFETRKEQLREYFANLENTTNLIFLPISARSGENIAKQSEKLSWYKGPTFLELLQSLKEKPSFDQKPFRFPIQGIQKDKQGKRILTGNVFSGTVKIGDLCTAYPSKQTAKVLDILPQNQKGTAFSDEAIGILLDRPLFLKRGDVLCKQESPPQCQNQIFTKIFWLGHISFQQNKSYLLKTHTKQLFCRVIEIHQVVSTSTCEEQKRNEAYQHELALCTLKTEEPFAFDLSSSLLPTSKFVLIDNYQTVAAGYFLPKHESSTPNVHRISPQQRAARFCQIPALIFVPHSLEILEEKLFALGYFPSPFQGDEKMLQMLLDLGLLLLLKKKHQDLCKTFFTSYPQITLPADESIENWLARLEAKQVIFAR